MSLPMPLPSSSGPAVVPHASGAAVTGPAVRRRAWLAQTGTAAAAAALPGTVPAAAFAAPTLGRGRYRQPDAATLAAAAVTAPRADPAVMRALAKRAVEAAKAAGASYADARVTRMVQHTYGFGISLRVAESTGLGVRALVNGYWGFAATPTRDSEEAARLGRAAVAQAKENAQGPPRVVELGRVPSASGHWATPVKIDPFTVSVEEKLDFIRYWLACAARAGVTILAYESMLCFAREERVLATSEGTLVDQTLHESGGQVIAADMEMMSVTTKVPLRGLTPAGAGWELVLEADIPGQLAAMSAELARIKALKNAARPATIGSYTLVCDGEVMAALLGRTLGVATQLDRALGYEANATGTSYLDDPLNMAGQLKVASPAVTITANRSAPRQLATVKWDDEGVTPEEFPLVKDGVLVDFQTTRESSAWLKDYYTKAGRPVRSHGCAAAQDALHVPLQQPPNLALAPGGRDAAADVAALAGSVKDGVLVEGAQFLSVDFQAKHGLFVPKTLRQIRNGRVGAMLTGGAVLFDTDQFWKNVMTVGGLQTGGVVSWSQIPDMDSDIPTRLATSKGQPPQLAGRSASAPAALVTNQTLIDPARKA